MTSRHRTAAVAILSFFLAGFCRELKISGSQTDHALRYDDGGIFRTTLDVPAKERAIISGQIREFIWNHWVSHRRARLRLIGQTIEGQFKIHRIIIKSDAQGHWHVRDEVQADLHPGAQPAKPQVTVDEYDQVRRTDMNNERIISDSEERAPGSYKLLLTNASKGLRWLF